MKYMFALVLSTIAFVFLSCGSKASSENAEKEIKTESHEPVVTITFQALNEIGLKLIRVEEKLLSDEIVVPAKLTLNQDLEAQVGTLVPGRVHKVFVNLGDYVSEGQILMHIQGGEVGEIKAAFLKAKAQLKFTEANYKRQKGLFDQNVVSQRAALEAESEYEKALAEFNAEHKRIHSIGLNDDDLKEFVEKGMEDTGDHSGGVLPIKAPISGTVVERNVVVGQFIDASTNTFKIVNTSVLWGEGQIYEKDFARITGKPSVTLTFPAIEGQIFKGTVSYIGQILDEHSRTIPIRAIVSNADQRLKPEMFGEMQISMAGNSKGVVVPVESVVKEKSETYVFVSINDSTFSRRIVEIGSQKGNWVEIRNGVKAGEMIVSKGTFFLKSELLKSSLGEE